MCQLLWQPNSLSYLTAVIRGKFCTAPTITNKGIFLVTCDDNNLYAFRYDALNLADTPWPKDGADLRNTHRKR